MYLDYSKIELDAVGSPIRPKLKLQTLSEETLGYLNGVHDLEFSIGFSELSEISFTVPYMVDGLVNPLYNQVTGYKVVYTKDYGVYLLTTPKIVGNGLEEQKSVKGYSLEKLFERKDLFLAEGVYNLFSRTDKENTIMAHILELDPDWVVAHVDDSLVGCYRSFDQYKGNALNFLYGALMEKYRCLVVFNPYKNEDGKREIYLYDADKDITTLPIYLSYANLIEEAEVTELSDELVTKLHVYGADNLSIHDVNPMGTDYIVNLDHFIENGDIPADLATKIRGWQTEIDSMKVYFSSLTALRAAETAKKLALQSDLVDLQGDLETKTVEQSAIIQALAMEGENKTNEAGKTWQEALDAKNAEINALKNEQITPLKNEIENLEKDIKQYTTEIATIVQSLSYKGDTNKRFYDEDYQILDRFMIEDTLSEETFVYSDMDTATSGTILEYSGEVKIVGDIEHLKPVADRNIYTFSNAKVTIGDIVGDVIRGTYEQKKSETYVMSLYLGETTIGSTSIKNGVLTITGESKSMMQLANQMFFDAVDSRIYISASAGDYYKYTVQQDLYDFAVNVLNEKSQATYEFSIDTANFLFTKEFEQFKNSLRFGSAIHLILGSKGRVDATFIGMKLDFSDVSTLSLVFSNRFQQQDGKTRLKQLLDKTYSSSRSFDASKYLYREAANKTSAITEMLNSSLNAAANNIIGASNQSVVINGAGIQIGGDSPHQMRIVNNMIAITDDNWQTADLAIGLMKDKHGTEFMHVNADVIMGNLVVGENLVIENLGSNGIVQFKVGGNGAQLGNATFSMHRDNGGGILLDPDYGIVSVDKENYNADESGMIVPPITNGKVDLDKVNFYLNSVDGSAYFNGQIKSTTGQIGGWTIEDGYLHSGTNNSYVALNSATSPNPNDTSDTNYLYAMWAGGSTPDKAKFYIKKDGTVKAKGVIDADSLSIKGKTALSDAGQITGNVIDAKGIEVYKTNSDGSKSLTFEVDEDGNVFIDGDVNVEGVLKVSDLEGGDTKIDGGWIKTGTIGAEAINLYGDLTVYQENPTINEQTPIGGYLGYAPSLSDPDEPGMHIASANLFSEVVVTDSGAKLYAKFGKYRASQIYVLPESPDQNGGCVLQFGDDTLRYTGGELYPTSSLTDLGNAESRWNQAYYTTGSIETSDRNLKKDISYDLSSYELLYASLKPASFRFIDGTSGRTHTGFISQDIEDSLENYNISPLDFAAFCKDESKDGTDIYGLRYEEFIALNTHMIQKLMKQIEDINKKIDNMQ